eukprot:g6.t1
MASLSADPIYAHASLPYRSPASCGTLPTLLHDSNAARSTIPSVPGRGTLRLRRQDLELTPVPLVDGRSVFLSHGETPTLDTHGFAFEARSPTNCIALADDHDHDHDQDTGTGTGTTPRSVGGGGGWQWTIDFANKDEVRERYFPEVERLVRAHVPEAEGGHVLIFDHALRTGRSMLQTKLEEQGGGGGRAAAEAWQGYAGLVHTDATVRSVHTRAKDQILGTNETEVKYGGKLPSCWGQVRPLDPAQTRRLFRAETEDHDFPEGTGGDHLIVNVWRPLRPVEQWGLAVLDGRTLAQGDVHPTIVNKFDNNPGGRTGNRLVEVGSASRVHDTAGRPVPVRYGEVLTPLHAPEHRWFYYPRMRPDEALVLKIFDSRRRTGEKREKKKREKTALGRQEEKAAAAPPSSPPFFVRHSCHTAFRDPLGPPDAHRESIEVRCLVILPPTRTGKPDQDQEQKQEQQQSRL